MKTKYDWKCVDPDVKFIETDSIGNVTGWIEKPMEIDHCFFRLDWKTTSRVIKFLSPFKGDWQDSLEERPNEN